MNEKDRVVENTGSQSQKVRTIHNDEGFHCIRFDDHSYAVWLRCPPFTGNNYLAYASKGMIRDDSILPNWMMCLWS